MPLAPRAIANSRSRPEKWASLNLVGTKPSMKVVSRICSNSQKETHSNQLLRKWTHDVCMREAEYSCNNDLCPCSLSGDYQAKHCRQQATQCALPTWPT